MERLRSNKGAAGIDGQTLSMIEQQGVVCSSGNCNGFLRAGEYRPQPVRRVYIPRPASGFPDGGSGRWAPGGAGPGGADGTKIIIEPIFEADFHDCSHGFRPREAPPTP